jgi:hypothetical protein
LSVPPPSDFAAGDLPCDRYGLQLVDVSAGAAPGAEEPAEGRPRRPFEYGLLTGFAVLQITYLGGLAFAARWALRRLVGV